MAYTSSLFNLSFYKYILRFLDKQKVEVYDPKYYLNIGKFCDLKVFIRVSTFGFSNDSHIWILTMLVYSYVRAYLVDGWCQSSAFYVDFYFRSFML